MPGTKKKGSPPSEQRVSGISLKPVNRVVRTKINQELSKYEEDNTGLQAAHASEQAGSSILHTGKQIHEIRQNRLRHSEESRSPANALKMAEPVSSREQLEDAAAKTSGSNPFFKQYQRASIKKEYRAVKAGKKSSAAAGKTARQATEKVSSASEKVVEYVSKKKHLILLLLLGGLLLFVVQGISACAPLMQAVMTSVTAGTYPAEESEIRAAELYYSSKEWDLQDELDNYAWYHPEIDEYTIEAQEIWHDPYALIALISAYNNGEEWTLEDAIPIMDMLFEWQYERKDTTTSTLRYYTETVDGKETIVWHTVNISQVTLKNKNLSHAPVYVMSREKVGLYALYMSTHGNMDGLFYGPHVSELKEPLVYDVPQQLLDADPKFAKLVEEANKRLGYPYVWGGYTPETSFDCSGFISWIFTETGVRNIGHMGATGLYSISRKISEADLKPGDVIFFSGTIEGESGITHCGLYVGNGMMIHCGSPCTYYDIAHGDLRNKIAGYGRLYEH
jgi:cell wall-associated NlpC family hydrolase